MQERSNEGYYKIQIKDINPYSDRKLLHTTYVLGSPGSGKTRLLNRLKDVTGGHLEIESGVYGLFEKCINEFIKRKRDSGYDGEILSLERQYYSKIPKRNDEYSMDLDPDFQMPRIDGLNFDHCIMIDPLEKTLDEMIEELRRKAKFTIFEERKSSLEREIRSLGVYSYRGRGVRMYREALGPQIKSGGKSGFPDWLFAQDGSDGYIQMISFPGHHPVSCFGENRSIPSISSPDSVLFLVDPRIDDFTRNPEDSEYSSVSREYGSDPSTNSPLKNLHLHLTDALRFEHSNIPVMWLLSKTDPTMIEKNKRNAERIYSPRNATIDGGTHLSEVFAEITRRIPEMRCFDSFQSSDDAAIELLKILNVSP